MQSLQVSEGPAPVWIRFEQGRSCGGHEESIEECKPTDLWNHDNYCR